MQEDWLDIRSECTDEVRTGRPTIFKAREQLSKITEYSDRKR